MKTFYHTLFATALLCLPAVATKQRSDFLEYQSRIYEFGHNGATPLVAYFKHAGIQPPEDFTKRAGSTNLWRGHRAHWRIDKDKLWLVSIYLPSHTGELGEGIFADLFLYPVGKIFPGKGPIVHADWFTGTLRLSGYSSAGFVNGEPVEDGSVRLLHFRKGVLVDRPAAK